MDFYGSVMDKEGSPHLAPVCFSKVLDKDKILVSINFATQTMYNIETYSKVAVGIAIHYDGYLVKGTGAIIKKGSQFEQVQEMVKLRFGDKIKTKAALTIYVEEVYSLNPGLVLKGLLSLLLSSYRCENIIIIFYFFLCGAPHKITYLLFMSVYEVE